ncbi:MAG: transcription termination/antitermination protein NusA [Candidatus Dadabacteria bacterium]|nr:MAG: transcription termination/antitermination protein NusA [Candidatus Dadabacteria bacterium]
MKDLNRVIDQVVREKGIDREVLIDALEQAMATAARRQLGNRNIEAQFNEETGQVEILEYMTVVEDVEDSYTQISLQEAREKYDPECEVGDELGIPLEFRDMGRITAQVAKQVIIQKVREAERELIYNEFIDRRGEIINGIVQRFERGDIIVNLGRTDAVLPHSEQIRSENYRQGDRIRALLLKVQKESRGPQLVLSRTHPDFVKKLFEAEVPEIREGIIEIKGCARDPGERAKLAVMSHDPDVDPVGACVGVRGSRVRAVVQELKGERIDIVVWNEEPALFAANALSPAQISRVLVDEERQTMTVIVPEDQLSLAIGRRGQNVKLAAKLMGWRLDIITEQEARRREEERGKMLQLPGMDPLKVALLGRIDVHTQEDLSKVPIPKLCEALGIETEEAELLREAARKAFEAELIAATSQEQEGAEAEPEEPQPESPAEEAAAGTEEDAAEEPPAQE